MAESLNHEWRPDGSLVITTVGEILEINGNLRLLFQPEAVEELRRILPTQPQPKVAGKHKRGPGT